MAKAPLISDSSDYIGHDLANPPSQPAEMLSFSPEDSALFRERAKEGIIVHEAPKLNLESYINEYEGRTQLDRLILIGTTSTLLSLPALGAALVLAKSNGDVASYLKIVGLLDKLGVPAADMRNQAKAVQQAPDTAWVEKREKTIESETNRLENELKVYKNNMIKESIRMGQEELGKHFYNAGAYDDANKAYAKMRDYCTTQKHVADLTTKLLFTAVAQRNWSSVSGYAARLQTCVVRPEERERLLDVAYACQGLAALATGRYAAAAEELMRVSPNYVSMDGGFAGIAFHKAVMTGNDIAVYGGLCALAAMERGELRHRVLANARFRQFLELEPQIRRAISAFVQSKYAACLAILDAYRADYLLDLHLHRHFEHLYAYVRSKSLVQYFIPFSTVTLAELDRTFPAHSEGPGIEQELVQMIQSGMLDARIDLVDKVLVAPKAVPRTQVQREAMEMAKSYERALRLRLVRVNMAAAGLEIKSEKGKGLADIGMDLAGVNSGGGGGGGFGGFGPGRRLGS